MSQYIPSFLLEPVVRQARRFSNSSLPTDLENDRPIAANHPSLPLDPDVLMPDANAVATRLPDPGHQLALTSGLHSVASRPQRPRESTEPGRFGRRDPSVPVAAPATQRHPRGPSASLPEPGTRPPAQQPYHGVRTSRSTSLEQVTSTSAASATAAATDGLLPENDGMRALRRKIIAIQSSDLSTSEKSRLVHVLMTERYSAQRAVVSPGVVRPPSALSALSLERPVTPESTCSMLDAAPVIGSPATSCSTQGAGRIHTTAQDRLPTYNVPPEQNAMTRPDDATENVEPVLGCAHYKRNVKLQCSECSRWYTCRFCHDELEDHRLNRRATRNMLCMPCGAAQPAAERCRECDEPAAWYYCDICKLWDNAPSKSIYHCDDCGICRVGEGLGKDFFHCQKCSACISIAIRDTHRCIERATDCDCPICGEYMFTSPRTVVFMSCGHSIHSACYREHMRTSYKCPLCSRSIVNMETMFRELDRAIEAQPMPEHLAHASVWISCNDCSARSRVRYHWLGLRCSVCDSYNTAQLQLIDELSAGEASITSTALRTTARPPDEIIRAARRGRGRPDARGSSPRGSSQHDRVLESFHPIDLEHRRIHRSNSVPPGGRRTHSMPSVVSPSLGLQAEALANLHAHPDPLTPSELTNQSIDSDGTWEAVGPVSESIEDYEEEDEDVDFWGGESPRSGSSRPRLWWGGATEMSAYEDEDEDDDSEDESLDDVSMESNEDDDDTHGEGAGNGMGRTSIELIGHR